MFDLHFHSDASDGEATFAAVLAAIATHSELRRFALTDHDAIAAAITLADHDNRAWIGAELTSFTQGLRMDLLALGVRPDDAALNDYLAGRVTSRRARFALFGQLLAAQGWVFEPPDEVWSKPQLARPHVVAELRRHAANRVRLAGLGVPSEPPGIGDDPIYAAVLEPLQSQIQSVTETDILDGPALVAMIRNAGGLAILAHPWISPYDLGRRASGPARALLMPLLAAGLDGLELWHPDQRDPAVAAEIAKVIADHGLLASGGSDDHTPDLGYLETMAPGDDIAVAALERLEQAWRARRAGSKQS
jgi:predicted metal-dependent phosphoesterase TrpH